MVKKIKPEDALDHLMRKSVTKVVSEEKMLEPEFVGLLHLWAHRDLPSKPKCLYCTNRFTKETFTSENRAKGYPLPIPRCFVVTVFEMDDRFYDSTSELFVIDGICHHCAEKRYMSMLKHPISAYYGNATHATVQ
jgi:hypothetical protein